ncbi:MAG: Gx transporter family protein [Candidatus Fimenecus sp.]
MKQKTYKIALLGLLAATAMVLSYLESLLPTAFLPPGAKPGFSNLANMFAAAALGLPSALTIAILKACFAGLMRGGTSFFMSLCGGVLSTFVMWILLNKGKKLGSVGIGVLSAVSHNLGQLAVAAVLVGNVSVFGYAPVLLLCALIAGTLTGLVFRAVLPALQKATKTFIKNQNGKE